MDNNVSSINIKIISLNIRGLKKSFSTKQTIDIWESEWGGRIFYSNGSNHSKGVMILVNPRCKLEVIKSCKDKNGKFIILDTKLDNQHLVLVNIYAPNDTSQQIMFFQELNKTLKNYADNNLIIGGNLNCALTPKDRKSVKQATNKHMVIKEIRNLCSHFDLTGIWRQLNPQTLSFTWHDKAFKTQSRLDFFVIAPDLVNTTKECNIMHAPLSDHSFIMLNLQLLDQRKRSGPAGFWKFNANLLEDEK